MLPLVQAGLAQDIATAIVNAFKQGISQFIMNFVNELTQQLMASTSQKVVLSTGAGVTYTQPVVIRFWTLSVTTVDLGLAIIVLWIAYNTILANYEPLRMMSRLVLAALGAHASLQFAGLVIEFNNALCKDALTTAKTPTTLDLVALLGLPVPGGRGIVDFLFQDLFIKVLADMVTFQMVVRIAILDLILALLPFFSLLLVLPETQGIAQLGFSAFVAVVFLQFLQVLAISLGSVLVTSLASTLSIASTFAGIAMLFFVLRIPGWVGGTIGSYISSIRSPI